MNGGGAPAAPGDWEGEWEPEPQQVGGHGGHGTYYGGHSAPPPYGVQHGPYPTHDMWVALQSVYPHAEGGRAGAGSPFQYWDDEDETSLFGDDDNVARAGLRWWLSRILYLLDRGSGKVKNQAAVRPSHAPL